MREILFRGKRLAGIDKDFVYGSLGVIDTDLVAIYQCKEFIDDVITLVDIRTVGQYTGLTDKNGKKIFEGDIVEFLGCKYEVIFEVGSFGLVGINDWEAIAREIPVRTGCDNDLHACLNDNYISLWEISWNLENEYNELNTVKIIGNIHDNPELLKGE